MNRRNLLKGLALTAMLPGRSALVHAQPSAMRYVFAHYMVAWPKGGPNASVDDYAAEFREAMARGIDGFALNCGGWSVSEPLYKARVLQMYRAAERFGGAFKLFVSADGKAQDELADIVRTTSAQKAQLKQDGKTVVSAYGLGGRDSGRCETLMREANGLGAWFIPHFSPSSGEATIGEEQAAEIAARSTSADGYFYFGAAAPPDVVARSTMLLSSTFKRIGKTLMTSVTPYYRGLSSGTNYRAFETGGFSGMAKEWRAAIDSGANWVQIVTWNDWAESTYVAPIGSALKARVYDARFGELLNHTAYLDASRYYIKWFKTGVRPAIENDALYYFYRLHPVDLATDLARAMTDPSAVPPRAATALTAQIHVTAFMTRRATLTVTCGANRAVFDLVEGVNEVSMPSAPGRPVFELVRNNAVVLQKTGEAEITRTDFSSAFNYFSGSL
ncbi:glycoside hydrolase family 71 protein [Paraburkholderia phenoliruptrix]|uniref:glycoside hydrolase family 71 protein n=1 Tax=Paraburkholderia phenoliruptrix TaxID=252970 RepID=UPI001C6F3DB1|nr:glycoside hydrolase family 71 protein [Paraburkholderia phenoliruptrix]MBW9106783.1 glycoside hydrolase family 71 [Paraburkholderia phenoliruptrix]MBW9131828.1 glycoside hydrolase family 71 [Paraburkholderia ginsengiterrae]